MGSASSFTSGERRSSSKKSGVRGAGFPLQGAERHWPRREPGTATDDDPNGPKDRPARRSSAVRFLDDSGTETKARDEPDTRSEVTSAASTAPNSSAPQGSTAELVDSALSSSQLTGNMEAVQDSAERIVENSSVATNPSVAANLLQPQSTKTGASGSGESVAGVDELGAPVAPSFPASALDECDP